MNGQVVQRIPADATGRGIAVGGGFVWVTDETAGALVQIDPTTNAVVGRRTVGTGPTGVAYGAGSVWVANALDDRTPSTTPSRRSMRRRSPCAV